MNSIFSSILVAVDDSQPSKEAVALAARLAREHGGRLVLAHCVNWVPLVAQIESSGAVMDPTPIIDHLRNRGAALVAAATNVAAHVGVEPESRVVEGSPAATLLELAVGEGCRMIAIGTHGRHGVKRFFIGSTAEAVLRGSSIPVLTVRPGVTTAPQSRRCFERVLVGIDDSEPSDIAIETVLALPPQDCRHVLFCSVAENYGSMAADGYSCEDICEDLKTQAQQVVEAAVASARTNGVAAEGRVLEGSTGEALVAAARDDRADLIVTGGHGRRGFRRFLLGSVAESVVRSATVPVLVVRTAPRLSGSLVMQAKREPSLR